MTNVCLRYRDPAQAREALEKMNGFDLAGRPIRVGLGNDKFTPESTAQMLQRFGGQQQAHAHGYEGRRTGGGGGGGGRNDDKNIGTGASALDDTDVAGVNFNNYSRDLLMRKLARQDEPAPTPTGKLGDKMAKQMQRLPDKLPPKPLPVNVPMASRCIVLRNMFDASEYVSRS